MLKKKISMVLAALMVATTVTGMNVQYASAAEAGISQSSFKLSDGEYTVKNITHYVDQNNATGEGMARNVVLEDSNITVKNGSIKMTVKFNSEMYGFLQNIGASLDGQNLAVENNAENMSVTFEIPSLDSKVLMNMNVTIMGRDVSFYLQNDANSLTVVNEAPVLTGTDVTVKKGDDLNLSKLVQALDKEDGALTPIINGDTSFVSGGKAIKPGTYTLTYKATDSKGFTGSKVINVTVEDVNDDSQDKEEVSETLKDGQYTLTNDVEYYKEGASQSDIEHGYSSARGVLNDSTKVSVKDGKIKMTLSFNEKMYGFLKDIKASLNGVDLNGINDDTARTITFDVPSLDSKILLSMGITMMQNDVSFYVLNDSSSLKEDAENSGDTVPGGDNNATDKDENITPDEPSKDDNATNDGTTSGDGDSSSNGGTSSDNTSNATKVYSIKNDVTHESATGVTMARQYLNSTSKVEEINGEQYVTLTFTGVEYMKDHVIYVDGNKVNHEVVLNNGSELSLRFKVPSLDSSIKADMYVIPMGRNIEFGVNLLKDTLTQISGDLDISGGNSGSVTPDSSTGNGSSSSEVTPSIDSAVAEENNVTEKVTVKEYTVKNNVVHENETGRSMARKYLNEISQVKEVNGKYYVTLTFTGKEFMSNYVISVNGNKVNHTVVANSGDSVSLRFEVSSLKDNIKVSTYVAPMSRNVEFGVELLLDSLTLVKEYSIEPDQVQSDLGLPSTGDATSKALAGFGLLAAGAGIVLTKKRK